MKILKSIDNYLFGSEEWKNGQKLWYYGPLTFGLAILLFTYVNIL